MPSFLHKFRHPKQRAPGGRRYGPLRQFVEFFVCLLLAVSLCKTFAVESYMIETGSMAPCLYGWHRTIVCPKCRFEFAVGSEEGNQGRDAVCPNCGQSDISLIGGGGENASTKSKNVIGDRVLVVKDRFSRRPPRRWEIAVFRNPNRSTENYVKRIVGLPGETIQIQNGNIHIDGEIQRKTLHEQRQMRILVFDNDYTPPKTDQDWQPQWNPADQESRWKTDCGSFTYSLADTTGNAGQLNWVAYRQWNRGGGLQSTEVPLSDWPEGAERLNPYLCNVEYDSENHSLSCRGVMTSHTHNRLSALSSDFAFQRAVEQLYVKSHISPITDRYGYNTASRETPVRDIQFEVQLQYLGGSGEFVVRMTDGLTSVDCRLDFERKKIQLFAADLESPIFEVPLPQRILAGGNGRLEVSLMDRQALVALDGEVVGQPYRYPSPAYLQPVPLCPVQFGAKEIDIRLESLKLYRDIYYLCKSNEAGFRGYELGADEYFALGDNSPVSEDSRVWLARSSPGKLTKKHFVGKPFLVHLPSKTWRGLISIPDVSRIRYIR